MKRYLEQFPDYDDTLPTLEGFHDSSYHNDMCPSLFKWLDEKQERFIQVFCDYKDESVREWDDLDRYTIFIDDHGMPAYGSNNWADIEQFIKDLNTEEVWTKYLNAFGVMDTDTITAQF